MGKCAPVFQGLGSQVPKVQRAQPWAVHENAQAQVFSQTLALIIAAHMSTWVHADVSWQ